MTPFNLGRTMIAIGTMGVPLCLWQLNQGHLLEDTPYLGTLSLLAFGAFLVWRYPRKPVD